MLCWNPFLALNWSIPAFWGVFGREESVEARAGACGLGFIKIDLFYIFWYKNWSDIHIFAG